MITRRQFAVGAGLTALGRISAHASEAGSGDAAAAFARIEARSGGRLGVAVRDTGTGRRAGHRSDERFPICSTFKVLAASAILAGVDGGRESLSRRVVFSAKDVVPYSPVTKERVGGEGMTLSELCAAAITMSDNTAGNMMLRQIGGPAGLTRYAASLGDRVTRLDRWETALNEAVPGDLRDTTAPGAMLDDLDALVLGTRLSSASRDQLRAWMTANTTGAKRLRAGLPGDWVVGDKTGTGDHGSANDVAVIWPPGRPPLIVCVYLTETTASPEACSASIAAVGRIVAEMAVG